MPKKEPASLRDYQEQQQSAARSLFFLLLLRAVIFSTGQRGAFYERQDGAKAEEIDRLRAALEELRAERGEGKRAA